jgi:hypothetical protein
MFEDEKSETVSRDKVENTNLKLADLKKIYAQQSQSSANIEISLCYSGKKVYIRPIKVKDKKDILKSVESKNEELLQRTLDDIIQKYAESADKSPILVDSLTQKEKEQIIVYMRLAIGDITDKIKIAHQCPQCEQIKRDIDFEISRLNVVNYDRANSSRIQLLDGVIELDIGPITLRDEKDIEALIKKSNIKSDSEKQLVSLAAFIKRIYVNSSPVDDVSTVEQKYQFVENLQINDLKTITEKIRINDFGIKMPFEFHCDKCGFKAQQEVVPAVFFMS